MLTVLLVLQIIITVSMAVVILIQRSSSDGMAGMAGGGNSLMSGRASANLLTKLTSILGTAFILNSLVMATIAARTSAQNTSLVDEMKIEQKKNDAAGALDTGAAPAAEKSGNESSADASVPENVQAEKEKSTTSEEKTESQKPQVPIAE